MRLPPPLVGVEGVEEVEGEGADGDGDGDGDDGDGEEGEGEGESEDGMSPGAAVAAMRLRTRSTSRTVEAPCIVLNRSLAVDSTAALSASLFVEAEAEA